MKEILVSPSILGTKKEDLIEVTDKLILGGANLIHFDVMDGNFVSNISFIDNEIDVLSNHVNHDILDVHLMCVDLDKVIPTFSRPHVKFISIHYEVIKDRDYKKDIALIKKNNSLPGLVINPDTDVHSIIPYLNEFSLILVMSVVPGKGGQSFMPVALDKIKFLDEYRKEHHLNYLIEVDGGINDATSKLCIEQGVDILVSGSYILKSSDYESKIRSLR